MPAGGEGQGRRGALWKEVMGESKVQKRRGNKQQEALSLSESNARRACTLVQEGQLARAAQALVSLGIERDAGASLQEMQDKNHHAAPPPVPEGEPITGPLVVSSQLMRGEEKENEREGEEVTVQESPELAIPPGGGTVREDNNLPANLPMGGALVEINSLLGVQLLPELAYSMTQWELSSLVDSDSHDRLLQATTSTRDLARLWCLEREAVGDWLGALPSKSLGLHLRKLEFVMAGRYRLGMKGEGW